MHVLWARVDKIRSFVRACGYTAGRRPWCSQKQLQTKEQFISKIFVAYRRQDGVKSLFRMRPYLYSARFGSVRFRLVESIGGRTSTKPFLVRAFPPPCAAVLDEIIKSSCVVHTPVLAY